MTQYIDKAAVMAEIEARYNECLKRAKIIDAEYWNGKTDAYRDMLVVLDTFEVKEVDLEKEIEEYLSIYWPNEKELHPFLGHMAKQFFELGLSYSVDESIVRKIVDLYFEASKHYDEVIKQERYRTGGSQLAIDILDGSKDMKELCVQYVLNKVTKL
jgi:hypothetical protein